MCVDGFAVRTENELTICTIYPSLLDVGELEYAICIVCVAYFIIYLIDCSGDVGLFVLDTIGFISSTLVVEVVWYATLVVTFDFYTEVDGKALVVKTCG